MPTTIAVGARSMFVTATAWVFILLAMVASAAVVVRNVMLFSLLPESGGSGLIGLMLAYMPWVIGAGAVVSLATLASAVGLLMRLDWARRVFIGLLAVAIVGNLVGLWLQHEMMQALVSNSLDGVTLPPQAQGVVGGFVTAVRVMAVVVTLGACAFLAWIMRRLMSAGVRREFA